MARELITWCDRCLHTNGSHTPATERRIGIGRQWWSADLCDDCSSELLDPVAKLLANSGRHLDLAKPAPAPTSAAASAAVSTLDPPNHVPSPREHELFEENLARRKEGKRRGKAGEQGLESPCIFCGIVMRNGGNAQHLMAHGFTKMSRALGTQCPYCPTKMASLGAHMVRTHSDVINTPIDLSKEMLLAHVRGAPYSQLEAIRARAYNVQPLDDVLRALAMQEQESIDA